MTKHDGGPAFPQVESEQHLGQCHADPWSHTYSFGGMSLRDYFAALFASSIPLDIADRIAAENLPEHDELSEDPDTYDEYVVPRAEIGRRVAVTAYFLADAMLKVREGK